MTDGRIRSTPSELREAASALGGLGEDLGAWREGVDGRLRELPESLTGRTAVSFVAVYGRWRRSALTVQANLDELARALTGVAAEVERADAALAAALDGRTG